MITKYKDKLKINQILNDIIKRKAQQKPNLNDKLEKKNKTKKLGQMHGPGWPSMSGK